jgi:hypothetical protein
MAYDRNPRRIDPMEGRYEIVFGLTIFIGIIALPAMMIGFTLCRLLARYLSSERLRLFIWLVPVMVSGYLYYQWYWHGLSSTMTTVYAAYLHVVALHFRLLEAWTAPTSQDLRNVWSVTWPFWIQTLGTFPLAALWFEASSNLKPNTLRQLQQEERRRQHKITQNQNKAARHVGRPKQVPDAAGGSMIIGVPIRQEDE